MLDLYYQYPRVLRRLRSGALGHEMERIAARLSEVGYKPASAKIYLERIARFSRFATRVGYGRAVTIDSNVIDRFLRKETPNARIIARTAIGHARQLLPERFRTVCRRKPSDPHGHLLADYAEHLRQVRGLQPKTCEGLMLVARRMIQVASAASTGPDSFHDDGRTCPGARSSLPFATRQRLHPFLDHLVHPFIPALPPMERPQ